MQLQRNAPIETDLLRLSSRMQRVTAMRCRIGSSLPFQPVRRRCSGHAEMHGPQHLRIMWHRIRVRMSCSVSSYRY